MGKVEEFEQQRARMNERILAEDNLQIRRFFNLDAAVYKSGALDARFKEMLGLTASMVLRCNDCIAYHLGRCVEAGATDAELFECFSIALIVGGSIVIPHLRFAVDYLDELRQRATA